MKKVMIVTGAATGIGLATARLLRDKYCIVGTFFRTPPETGEFTDADGIFCRCDVSSPEECVLLVETAQARGTVAGLVHCAAINPTPAPAVAEMEPDFWQRILHNNLDSAFYLARAIVPALRSNGGGAIVFASSTAGRRGFSGAGASPGHGKVAYAVSKAGIIALTKGLAFELAAENIRVNCMAAGPIDTRMLPNREDVAKRVPLGRTGTPEEAAAAIAFLLDEATYTTGCTLDVCGGQYMN